MRTRAQDIHAANRARKADSFQPQPTPHFRRRAWLEFERALDPLAAPKPIRRPQPH